ncbi:hypothetical protein MRX96_011808 [Rhipicephalus microplus]
MVVIVVVLSLRGPTQVAMVRHRLRPSCDRLVGSCNGRLMQGCYHALLVVSQPLQAVALPLVAPGQPHRPLGQRATGAPRTKDGISAPLDSCTRPLKQQAAGAPRNQARDLGVARTVTPGLSNSTPVVHRGGRPTAVTDARAFSFYSSSFPRSELFFCHNNHHMHFACGNTVIVVTSCLCVLSRPCITIHIITIGSAMKTRLTLKHLLKDVDPHPVAAHCTRSDRRKLLQQNNAQQRAQALTLHSLSAHLVLIPTAQKGSGPASETTITLLPNGPTAWLVLDGGNWRQEHGASTALCDAKFFDATVALLAYRTTTQPKNRLELVIGHGGPADMRNNSILLYRAAYRHIGADTNSSERKWPSFGNDRHASAERTDCVAGP